MQAWEFALDLKHETEAWWLSDTGRRFSRTWSASRADDSSLAASNEIGMIEAVKLAVSPPFYVTGEMVDLLEHAAQSFPDTPLHPSDLMLDHGFVLFARSVQTMDIHRKPLPWRAFSWGLAGNSFNPEETVGIHLSLYAHKDDDPQREEANLGGMHDIFSTLALVHETAWTFGHEYTADRNKWVSGTKGSEHLVADDEAIADNLHILHTIHAFFLLVQQRIGTPQGHTASRAVRRRLFRSDPNRPIPDVRVITLRRRRPPKEAGEHVGGGREYSHRWWVNGHWRRQWYESEGRHKPKFIEGYVKGPEDKPFQQKDTTYLWRR